MTASTLTAAIQDGTWLDDWQRWHADREQAAGAPHGLTSVTGTHWLDAEPVSLPTVVGRWSVRDGAVVGTDVPGVDGDVVVRPGADVELGDVLLRVVVRDGVTALRVLDPAAVTRREFTGIDTFAPDPAFVVEGTFIPAADASTVTIEHRDGVVRENPLAGTVRFTVDGTEVALSALVDPAGLQITFADATTGTDTQQFRFLTVARPTEGDAVVVDLNRAYLPPCAFTDHFLCPLPPVENRLDVAIRAGETVVRTAEES